MAFKDVYKRQDQNGMELFYRTMDYLKKNFDLAIILISHDLDLSLIHI